MSVLNGDEAGYLGDVLQDNGNGCRLDLRVKLAIEFLKSNVRITSPRRVAPVPGGEKLLVEYDSTIEGQAAHALELADALLAQARSKGWIKDLPENGELTGRQKAHIERCARTNVYQNEITQKIAMQEGGGPQMQIARGRVS